jgi:hypothetical protein
MENVHARELLIFFGGAILSLLLLIKALTTGRVSGRGLDVNRNDQPALFHFFIVTETIAVLFFLGSACKAAIQLTLNRMRPR